MKTKEYNKMINDAIREFEGMNINYKGLLMCLLVFNDHVKYIPQTEVAIAKERINILKHLKAIDLLK